MDMTALLKESGMTVLIGAVVVFSVLVLLTLIFKLFGVVAGSLAKGESDAQPMQKPPVPMVKPQPVASVPAVQNGVPEEIVAVIAAAVAAMSAADSKTYAVRRISRAATGRSAWAAAGIADNTRSF